MEKTFIRRYWPTLVGIILGALGGYLYWRFVGCTTGSCPITSSPVNSGLWGAVMGGLVGNMFQPDALKKDEQNNQ